MRTPAPAPPPGRPYVLLVESEVEDEALAQRVLKKYRIANHVDWAKNGEEALKLLRERLAAPDAPGRGADETNQVRARPLENGSAGHNLFPASGSSRAPESVPSRMAGAKAANGASPPPGLRGPEMILISFDQEKVPALDTVARIRSLPGMANVPVAILCRTPDQERQVRESSLPRVASLSKPIGFFKLLECIQRMDMYWFVFAEKP
jgi:hypothetical protein